MELPVLYVRALTRMPALPLDLFTFLPREFMLLCLVVLRWGMH